MPHKAGDGTIGRSNVEDKKAREQPRVQVRSCSRQGAESADSRTTTAARRGLTLRARNKQVVAESEHRLLVLRLLPWQRG
jgi:hypothetical protein